MSTTANIEVFQAQAALDAAKQRQQEEQRQHDTDKLANIRSDKREKRAELHKIEGSHKRNSERLAHVQNKLNQVLLKIDQSWRDRPAVADIPLLHDPEVIAWKRDHKRLEDERDKLIEQRNSVPQVDLLAAVRLAEEIRRLEYAEQNLLDKLNGSLGKVPASSIGGVHE